MCILLSALHVNTNSDHHCSDCTAQNRTRLSQPPVTLTCTSLLWNKSRLSPCGWTTGANFLAAICGYPWLLIVLFHLTNRESICNTHPRARSRRWTAGRRFCQCRRASAFHTLILRRSYKTLCCRLIIPISSWRVWSMYHCLWNRLGRLDVRNDFHQAEAVIRLAAGWGGGGGGLGGGWTSGKIFIHVLFSQNKGRPVKTNFEHEHSAINK